MIYTNDAYTARYRRDRFWDDWGKLILYAALITLCIWGVTKCYGAGKQEMLAEPPQVIVDKSHTTSSYSCGNNCITNSDNWTLLAESGDACDVSRSEYARAKIGQEWKCTQLFGWSQH